MSAAPLLGLICAAVLAAALAPVASPSAPIGPPQPPRGSALDPKTRHCPAARGPCATPLPLPHCAAGHVGLPVAEVIRQAAHLAGQRVAVDGPLRMALALTTVRDCTSGSCCDSVWAGLALGPADVQGSGGLIELRSPAGTAVPRCAGDKSRQCCDVPVRGQRVIAIGTLAVDAQGFVSLAGVALCEPEI